MDNRKLAHRLGVGAMLGAVLGAFAVRRHVHRASTGVWLFSPAMDVSIALWVAFSIYWTIAARDQAPTRSAESLRSRQWHLLIINAAQLVLILPVPGLRWRLLPDAFAIHAAGLVLQGLATIFAVWARRHLGSNWSGEVRIASAHRLIRSGPYGVVRHPIYTALVGMYLGTAIVSGELHGLVGLAMMLLAYARKIHMEERVLAAAFPGDYDRYRRETWAWIPGIY